jgi:hypothetical protein
MQHTLFIMCRFVTVPARTRRRGGRFRRFCEFRPGQILRPRNWGCGKMRLRYGWVRLPRGSYRTVRLEDFIIAWQSRPNAEDAASELGLTVDQAARVARWLTKKGVDLKQMS